MELSIERRYLYCQEKGKKTKTRRKPNSFFLTADVCGLPSSLYFGVFCVLLVLGCLGILFSRFVGSGFWWVFFFVVVCLMD